MYTLNRYNFTERVAYCLSKHRNGFHREKCLPGLGRMWIGVSQQDILQAADAPLIWMSHNFYLKGIIRRKPRWVKSVINQ
jgi:hypothetical protein